MVLQKRVLYRPGQRKHRLLIILIPNFIQSRTSEREGRRGKKKNFLDNDYSLTQNARQKRRRSRPARRLRAGQRGWQAAYNCTDGVFIDDEVLATGDYSGPAGGGAHGAAAKRRTAGGHHRKRRGAASCAVESRSRRPDVAVVTNVSSDHFGEYGIR